MGAFCTAVGPRDGGGGSSHTLNKIDSLEDSKVLPRFSCKVSDLFGGRPYSSTGYTDQLLRLTHLFRNVGNAVTNFDWV